MSVLNRFREWWLGQYRSQHRLGKAIWVGVPSLVALMFSCCFCSLAMARFAPRPPVTEPTAAIAERSAEVDLEQTEERTDELTMASTVVPATPTRAPTATEKPATNTPRPSATARPTTATSAASATSVPPTATRPAATATSAPPTATVVRAATIALPTATQPPATAAPLPTASAVPPTAVPPTALPQPTATLPPAVTSGDVIISSVRYDGDVPQVESDEYAVIINRGGSIVNLAGWRLNAGEPDQNFSFPSFDLQPGQSCRVYTNEVHPESCGFTFGRGDAIWRNSGDCGYLFNAEGAEVSRYCW